MTVLAGAAGILTIVALSVVASTFAAPPTAAPGPAQPVVVENTPLEVSGTVSVSGDVGVSGTVAATQSGTWNVGLTGTPTVESADDTVLVGSFAGDVPGNNQFTEAVTTRDASAYRSVRVATNCFAGATVCGNIYVRVYTVVGNRSYLMDQFTMRDFVVAGDVYEVVGTTIAVQLLNTNASTTTNIGVAVFGRAN